jgi:predicted porin
MKKQLFVATFATVLALPAAAQVTVSGRYGVGIVDTVQDGKGVAVSDGNITFSAQENIGSGITAGANLEIRIRGREAATQAEQRNATVFIQGPFGRIHGGGIELANGIYARGSAGAPIALSRHIAEVNATQVLAGETNSEYIRWDSPRFNGFMFSTSYSDQIGRGRVNQSGYHTTQHLTYTSGSIDATYDYTKYSNLDSNAKRHRISGNYNFGFAVIGAGYEERSTVNKGQYIVGVRVPAGKFTLGALYAENQQTEASAWAVGGEYALSKRTNVNLSYSDKTGTPAAGRDLSVAGGTRAGSQYQLRLLHTF